MTNVKEETYPKGEIVTPLPEKEKSMQFQVGDIILVNPTGFKQYGVFCKCPNGYTGLIHISRITTKFVRNVSDFFTIGQEIQAEITEIHPNEKKLSLSTKGQKLEEKKQGSAIDENGSGFNELKNNLDTWMENDDSN